MTDYEILSVMIVSATDISEKLSVLMSTLTGFLLASVFIARKINRIMSVIFVGLYTVFYAVQVFGYYAMVLSNVDYAVEVNARTQANESGLAFMSAHDNLDGIYNLPTFWLIILSVAYIASIVFYIQARKTDFSVSTNA
jgi:hypothetical protein